MLKVQRRGGDAFVNVTNATRNSGKLFDVALPEHGEIFMLKNGEIVGKLVAPDNLEGGTETITYGDE